MSSKKKSAQEPKKKLTEVQSQLQLFSYLKECGDVPMGKKEFTTFVKTKFTESYSEPCINSVWLKLRNCLNRLSVSCPEISCSNGGLNPVNNTAGKKKRRRTSLEVIYLSDDEEQSKLNCDEKCAKKSKSSRKKTEKIKKSSDAKGHKRKSVNRSPGATSAKKKKWTKGKKSFEEIEALRRDLFVEKLIEIAMPAVVQEEKRLNKL